MKLLIKHITHLISHNNCVIIPGLGAFIAHNISARYDVKEQTFMPPYRTIIFNPVIKIDDALLLSAYMEYDNVSYQQAELSMNKDIDKLRKNLASNGIVQFGELGTFCMDINNSIIFKAATNGIDDPYNFGFQPILIETLHNQSDKVITIKRRELSRYIAAAAAIILMFLFVTPISDRVYDGNIKASLSGFASSEQISMMQQLMASSPEKVVAVPDCEITPLDYSATKGITTSRKETNEVVEVNAEKEVIAEVKLEEPANKETGKGQSSTNSQSVNKSCCYIIVASTPNEQNAQLAIQELNVKHKADYSVVKCGKRHRIAISSFNNEKEAQNNLSQVQAIFPDAWILTL